jgi:hypothetical protein
VNILNSILTKQIDLYLNQVNKEVDFIASKELSKSIFIDPKNLRPFSQSINYCLINRLNKTGFSKINFPPNLIEGMCKSIKSRIEKAAALNDDAIEAGYSIPIIHLLSKDEIKLFKKLGKFLCKQEAVRNYMFFPSVIGVHAFYSRYSPKASINPTRAFLWHRDADCHLNQLKLMLPLNSCKETNGMFSALSKEACSRGDLLRDPELIKRSEKDENNESLISDALYRMTDETARGHIKPDFFLDLKNHVGEALLIDTNNCYHKGGLVTKEGEYRILIQISLGSFIHTWHKDRLQIVKNLRKHATDYFVKKLPIIGSNHIHLK